MATKYAQSHSMLILDRNWFSGRNEADIVALDGHCLVIVEVKTRLAVNKLRYPGLISVDQHKRNSLSRLAQRYVRHNAPLLRRLAIKSARIDCIEVYYSVWGFMRQRVVTEICHSKVLEIPTLPT